MFRKGYQAIMSLCQMINSFFGVTLLNRYNFRGLSLRSLGYSHSQFDFLARQKRCVVVCQHRIFSLYALNSALQIYIRGKVVVNTNYSIWLKIMTSIYFELRKVIFFYSFRSNWTILWRRLKVDVE